MARSRVLAIAFAAAFVATGVCSLPAAAAPVRPPSDHVITTAHFEIHYYTDLTAPGTPAADYSSETQAGDVASYAEQAYALESSWGLPVPLNDGDGLIDIYLVDNTVAPLSGALGEAVPDNAGPAGSSGMIFLATPTELDAAAAAEGLTPEQEELKTIAHELFHLFQFATWVPTDQGDDWLLEASAQWAGLKAIGDPASAVVTDTGPPEIPLDCRDTIDAVHQMCDPDLYVEGGYSRWAFFELLADTYGTSFLHNVLVNGAAGQSATTALSNALAAKGTSLASVFTTYANDLMTGNFGVPALSTTRPSAYAVGTTGTTNGSLPPITVAVDHLAVRYIAFSRGDGSASQACYAAKLTLDVTMPSGVSSQPYYFWDAPGSTPQPLSISGNKAAITVPWDTCDWGTTYGWLSLPNSSTSVDAAMFTVNASIAVDTTTPASSTSAPPPVSVWGTAVPVPTADDAPELTVFGPALLKLSATSRQIRLIIDSSSAGSVNATLGSVLLGTSALRAGNNDVRFTVPASMLGRLRSGASAATLLTLTPVSPSGAVSGTPVTRQVSIAPAVKPKPKPKKKPKK